MQTKSSISESSFETTQNERIFNANDTNEQFLETSIPKLKNYWLNYVKTPEKSYQPSRFRKRSGEKRPHKSIIITECPLLQNDKKSKTSRILPFFTIFVKFWINPVAYNDKTVQQGKNSLSSRLL